MRQRTALLEARSALMGLGPRLVRVIRGEQGVLTGEEMDWLTDAIHNINTVAKPDLTTEYKLLDNGYLKLVDWMGDDLSPLEAARMSTDNPTGVDEKKDDGLRDYMWRNHHTSPFEFIELVVEVQCPLFVRSQWHRHRTQTYNEFSGRYSEMPDLCYTPKTYRIKGKGNLNKQGSEGELSEEIRSEFLTRVTLARKQVRQAYEWAQKNGIANEIARIDIPLSQYTKFRAKANLLNWFRFLTLRMDSHAQEEIRVYANAVAELIKQLFPKCWAVYEEHTLHGRHFSRSEMEVIRKFLRDSFLPNGSVMEDQLSGLASAMLPESRAKEFMTKFKEA